MVSEMLTQSQSKSRKGVWLGQTCERAVGPQLASTGHWSTQQWEEQKLGFDKASKQPTNKQEEKFQLHSSVYQISDREGLMMLKDTALISTWFSCIIILHTALLQSQWSNFILNGNSFQVSFNRSDKYRPDLFIYFYLCFSHAGERNELFEF